MEATDEDITELAAIVFWLNPMTDEEIASILTPKDSVKLLIQRLESRGSVFEINDKHKELSESDFITYIDEYVEDPLKIVLNLIALHRFEALKCIESHFNVDYKELYKRCELLHSCGIDDKTIPYLCEKGLDVQRNAYTLMSDRKDGGNNQFLIDYLREKNYELVDMKGVWLYLNERETFTIADGRLYFDKVNK